jgi:hypothetical protein
VRRLCSLLVVLSAAPLAWADNTELGALLPDGAHKVAEHRFRSPTDFEGTLKFYGKVYDKKDYPRRVILNQPGIKAVHIANPSGKSAWEGLNISEANEEVRIYVVPADTTGKKKTAGSK